MENKNVLFPFDNIFPKESNYIGIFSAFSLNGNQSLIVID